MEKTVLFVAYGGGHARMLAPVIRLLQPHKDIRIEALALTTGGAIFEQEGLPYRAYRHLLRAQDSEARAWGERLAARHHSPESGMPLEESVAYLGLCYWDLAQRHGEAEAARRWEEQGRHAFLPLTVMERVIDMVRPDLVVATNSPKSERAALEVAKKRGIPTMGMTDLFGIHHFYPLDSDYITILSERAIENLENEGVRIPREGYLVTGNPAFDPAFDHRGPVDYAWRSAQFPSVPRDVKTLLWIDMPAYWHVPTRTLHTRSDEEIVRDLDDMAAAASGSGCHLLVRPHPSQPRELYDRWLAERRHPHAHYAGGVPLYPLLKAVDAVATYTSTVSVEALLMERPVIQLKYYEGHSDMPLGAWDMAWLVESPDAIASALKEALHDEAQKARRRDAAARLLPQEKAAPKVAGHILDILSRGQRKKLA